MIFKPKYLTISGWGLLILGGDQPFLVGEFWCVVFPLLGFWLVFLKIVCHQQKRQDLFKYAVPTYFMGMTIPTKFVWMLWRNLLFPEMLLECLLVCLTLYTCIISLGMQFTGLWDLEVLGVNQNLFLLQFLDHPKFYFYISTFPESIKKSSVKFTGPNFPGL